MKRTTRYLAVPVGLMSFALAACGAASPTGTPTAAPPTTAATVTEAAGPDLTGHTIRVIYTGDPDPNEAVLFHAEDVLRGWGADVQVTQGGSSTIVLGAITNGQADVAELSPKGGLSAVVGGLDIKAFALSMPHTDDVFTAKSSITKLTDLGGSTVGVNQVSDLSGMEAALALGAGNLTMSDVSMVEVGGQGTRVAALVAGRIDATPIALGTYTATLQSQGFNLLYNFTSDQPDLVHSVLWAAPSWLSGHQDDAVAFNEALLLSYRWFDNTANKSAFVDQVLKVSPGATAEDAGNVYDTYIKYNFFPPDAILTVKAMTTNQDLFVQYKQVDASTPVAQWVDTSAADAAITQVGQ